MIYNFGTSNINVKLQQAKARKGHIDRTIASSARSKGGTLNMDYFRLKRESKQLQEQIIQINRSLHPDIIA